MMPTTYSIDRDFTAFQVAEGPRSPKLLDVFRDTLRVKHYSARTEDTYVAWVRNFILFHDKRHPREMGVEEIGQFLTHLAAEKDETALARFRPQRSHTVPTVLSKEEVKRLLANLTGTPRLVAQVMYGGGLRV